MAPDFEWEARCRLHFVRPSSFSVTVTFGVCHAGIGGGCTNGEQESSWIPLRSVRFSEEPWSLIMEIARWQMTIRGFLSPSSLLSLHRRCRENRAVLRKAAAPQPPTSSREPQTRNPQTQQQVISQHLAGSIARRTSWLFGRRSLTVLFFFFLMHPVMDFGPGMLNGRKQPCVSVLDSGFTSQILVLFHDSAAPVRGPRCCHN